MERKSVLDRLHTTRASQQSHPAWSALHLYLSGHEPAEDERVLRRTAISLSWIQAGAVLAALWVQAPDYDPLDRVALPLLAFLNLVVIVVLWQTRLSVRWTNLSSFFFAALYLLLAYDHQFRVFAPKWGVLSENTYWFAALNVAAYLIFPARLAGGFVRGIVGLVVLLSVWHLLIDPVATGQKQLIGSVAQFVIVLLVTALLQAHLGAIRDRMVSMRLAAHQDALTGIANRRAAEERLARLEQSRQTYTVVLFDIDHFKQVNDRYGHAVGDRVLRMVAQHAAQFVPPEGQLSRWGGEEFLMILPPTPESKLRGHLDDLRGELSRLSFGDFEGITVCMGVAEARAGEPSAEVVQRADYAMYFAKHSGRNAVHFAQSSPDLSVAAHA